MVCCGFDIDKMVLRDDDFEDNDGDWDEHDDNDDNDDGYDDVIDCDDDDDEEDDDDSDFSIDLASTSFPFSTR